MLKKTTTVGLVMTTGFMLGIVPASEVVLPILGEERRMEHIAEREAVFVQEVTPDNMKMSGSTIFVGVFAKPQSL